MVYGRLSTVCSEAVNNPINHLISSHLFTSKSHNYGAYKNIWSTLLPSSVCNLAPHGICFSIWRIVVQTLRYLSLTPCRKNLNQYQLFIIESIYIISLCHLLFTKFGQFNTLREGPKLSGLFQSSFFCQVLQRYWKFCSSYVKVYFAFTGHSFCIFIWRSFVVYFECFLSFVQMVCGFFSLFVLVMFIMFYCITIIWIHISLSWIMNRYIFQLPGFKLGNSVYYEPIFFLISFVNKYHSLCLVFIISQKYQSQWLL